VNARTDKITLVRKQDQVFASFADGRPEVPVKLIWLRPFTGRGEYLSVLDSGGKEIAMFKNLDCLDPNSRKIAEEEIRRRYFIPRILKVQRTFVCFGRRYWDVETDHGPRRFVMRSPVRNAVWVTDDRLILIDTAGNCYEIESFAALDRRSQIEARRML